MTSYRGLLNKIEAFCYAHFQIKKYAGEFKEQMPNFSTQDEKFPIVYVVPSGDLSDLNTNQFTLDIYCVDIIQKDRANINTIISDCNLIVNDLYLYFLDGNDLSIDVIGASAGTPINNFDLDYSAGWVKTITFEVQSYSVCAIPMNPINPNPHLVCDPATYRLLDTLDNVLASGSINSGANADIVVQDSSVVNSDASYSASIVAEGSLTLPDITIDVQNSLGQTVNTTTSPSVQDVVLSAPDAYINIKKTGGGVIATVTIPSGTSTNYDVADNSITVNAGSGFTIDATDPLDIVLKDGTGTTVTPTSVTPNAGSHKVDIVLPTAPSPTYATARLMRSGVTTSYATYDAGYYQRGRGASFYKLVDNNPFGHTWRFTGTSGGYYDSDTSQYKTVSGTVTTLSTAFPNNIMIDWATKDATGVQLWALQLLSQTSLTWDVARTTCNGLTVGGLSVWYLCETVEADSLRNWQLAGHHSWLPLNFEISFWSANTNPSSTTVAYYKSGMQWAGSGKANLFKYLPTRWTLLSELGL